MTTAGDLGAMAQVKPKPKLAEILLTASKKAIGGGIAGALAMVVQVAALMWMRTTINYQHSKGTGTLEAMAALYAEGGIARFYQGWLAALLQAPLSRFGDTAANAGMLALLEDMKAMPAGLKTLCASIAAALFRIAITPIDTLKTTLQVRGPSGVELLRQRVQSEGILTLYSGAIGTSVATLMGHYPWFVTYNFLQAKVPAATGLKRQLRSAIIGFFSSLVSDVFSNSVRVVKTAKQTADTDVGYLATASKIIAEDGINGLFLRGLSTKILSNGLQAMLFTICWRYFEEKINAYQKRKAAAEAQSKKD
ncbi:hypothetical protein AB1Y20_023383 [Prymnesium parvum]|uniref:ADP,ATP carrier protein n=1 Tax=Prymnesium parvum TaxID=97485 RepID=A0AB34JGU7_PRYPA